MLPFFENLIVSFVPTQQGTDAYGEGYRDPESTSNHRPTRQSPTRQSPRSPGRRTRASSPAPNSGGESPAYSGSGGATFSDNSFSNTEYEEADYDGGDVSSVRAAAEERSTSAQYRLDSVLSR